MPVTGARIYGAAAVGVVGVSFGGTSGGGPAGGGGDGMDDASDEDAESDDESSCDAQLVELGNKLADASGKLADVSSILIIGGLGTTFVGTVSAQPEIVAVGIAVTGTGGVGGVGAGLLQFTAGILQGIGLDEGLSGYSNAYYSASTLFSGGVLHRVIRGPIRAGQGTVSQRASDRFMHNSANVVGGVYDALTHRLEQLGPQSKTCQPH